MMTTQLEPSDELTALCYQVGSLRRHLIKQRSTLPHPGYHPELKPEETEETRTLLDELPGLCRGPLAALRDFQANTHPSHFQDACTCLEKLAADPSLLFRAPALQTYQNLRTPSELLASLGVDVEPAHPERPHTMLSGSSQGVCPAENTEMAVKLYGKTHFVRLALLQALLTQDANDGEKRSGMLIFDEMGEMVEFIRAIMAAAGRTDELLVIGRNGNSWVDPFFGKTSDSRTVSERLWEMVRGIHSSNGSAFNDEFLPENIRRILQVAAVMAKARHLGDMTGMEEISNELDVLIKLHKVYCSDDDGEKHGNLSLLDETKSMLELAAGLGAISTVDAALARNYIEFEDRQLSQRTWATIINCACGLISFLLDSKLAPILTPSPGWAFCADEIIDRGRVVVVALNRDNYGPQAGFFENLIKSVFLESALQRRNKLHFDGYQVRPINLERPVYIVGDEFLSVPATGG